MYDGPFGFNLKASEYVSNGVPIERLQHIDRNAFVIKNIRLLPPEKAANLARHEFWPYDILLTKLGNPLGKPLEQFRLIAGDLGSDLATEVGVP